MKTEITSVAAGAGASFIAGTVLGLPIAALFSGFCGGLVMLSLRPPVESWTARFWSLVASTACAGFLGPLTAAWLDNAKVSDMAEIMGFGFVWGGGAKYLFAKAIDALGNRIDQVGGKQRADGE